MSAGTRTFLLDSNILIGAKRSYYAFDLCPGFWDAIRHGHRQGRILSTKRVQKEIAVGEDDLSQWVKNELPPAFFIDDNAADIMKEFSPMMAWVNSGDYLPEAVQEFAGHDNADGWLIAAAKARNFVLVTEEQSPSNARKRVPMPNVCDEFGVEYITTFEALRELGYRFVLAP